MNIMMKLKLLMKQMIEEGQERGEDLTVREESRVQDQMHFKY